MDRYEAIHGQDVSSFDLTSTHRLPTVSAAQALEDLKSDPRRFLSTGLDGLDSAVNDVSTADPDLGGIEKGQVVEVWGPPGSGKTAFAMQLAANTLRDGSKVVWVASQTASTDNVTEDQLNNLLHFVTPSLAHLIGLICKPTTSSIPADTSLVVIDNLSGLVNQTFPKNLETRQPPKGRGPSARRLQVLQFLISALQKLSATRDLVIVVLSQCATRMQLERGATLIPAINAGSWEQGIATRLVLFRDWVMRGDAVHDMHLVGIQKHHGKVDSGGIGPVFAFDIQTDGLIDAELHGTQPSLTLSATPHQKRKLDQTGFEIPDSEGEDYGWEDEDTTEMPSMPPQWQGSEDLLVGQIDDDANRVDEDAEGHLAQSTDEDNEST
ncbi:Uu.00g049810.m01.CDS01 [Anthostomella pinea]|uniref:Uu.00g049810.m01.CDS01 n=1 Tax=Anthostomella pinea TaxID=933095 RepID=A0AAI8YEY7_9PEZI|nr:Uu.00g049810.m01.CDS01 [Anthostomella pinea]